MNSRVRFSGKWRLIHKMTKNNFFKNRIKKIILYIINIYII